MQNSSIYSIFQESRICLEGSRITQWMWYVQLSKTRIKANQLFHYKSRKIFRQVIGELYFSDIVSTYKTLKSFLLRRTDYQGESQVKGIFVFSILQRKNKLKCEQFEKKKKILNVKLTIQLKNNAIFLVPMSIENICIYIYVYA